MPSFSPMQSLIDMNFILINRIVVLAATLLFFCGVALVMKLRGQRYDERITAPIKLTLFGFFMLYAETVLTAYPRYQSLVAGFQTIILLS